MEQTVEVKINDKELDTVIEKANQLVELLEEVQQIIDSLSGKEN